MTESLEFYFDPMCPYAFQTSLWIREVQRLRDLDVTWRFFSLEEINLVAGKPHPWERPWSYGFGQMRVGALIRRELGNDALDRWYAAVGHAFFFDGRKTQARDVHERVIVGAGFDGSFVERAIADESTLDEVREEHQDAVTRHGAHGVPTLIVGDSPGYAVYGPVVVPAPMGDDAAALWDLVREMPRFQLYELRHPKTRADIAEIGEHFRTYLTTRDWQTIENPAP